MPWSDTRVRLAIACAEAWVLLPVFAVALRLAPGPVLRGVRRAAPTVRVRDIREQVACVSRVAAAVDRAAAWLPTRVTTCLPRACAAHVMLARHGVESRLRIGVVKTTGGGVNAHAWIEAEGTAIGLDRTGRSFVPLPAL
jgi:hypothetical protein